MNASFLVVDAVSGETVAARNPDAPMLPASCAKLLTAAAALMVLGADHRCTNQVLRDGDDVYLRGGGDPGMEPQALAALAARTAAELDTPVRVHIDESRYPRFSPAPGWAADHLPVEVQPVVPLALREYFGHDPGRAAGEALAGAVTMNGVDARFDGRATAPAGARIIAEVPSRTVGDQVVHLLHSSHNLTAEVLHREVALGLGEPATWEGAGNASRRVATELGLDAGAMVRADGSGLSYDNRMSARLLAGLLRLVVLAEPPPLAPIRESLPLAGLTGTLSAINDWFQRAPADRARGYLRAKPGTLSQVVALAGITSAPAAPARVFAILAEADKPAVERLAADIACGDPISPDALLD